MPIRFQCNRCGQHLSIARRKAGTEIACPRCGLSQAVPGEPAPLVPAGDLSAGDDRRPGGAEWPDSDPVGPDWTVEGVEEEDLPRGIPIADDRVESATSAGADAAAGEGQAEAVPLEVEREAAGERLSFEWDFSRSQPPPLPADVNLDDTIDLVIRTEVAGISGGASPPPPPPGRQGSVPLPVPGISATGGLPHYVQVLVLLVVAATAFSGGYYLGRHNRQVSQAAAPAADRKAVATAGEGFAEEEVLLEARLLWTPNVNEASGDAGAVLLAIPQRGSRAAAMPVAGLRPGSPDGPESQNTIDAVRSAGGAFSRAESDGTVAAVLPREGRYYLLMISKHVLRPEGQPVLATDLADMKRYLADPEELIGPNKYAWQLREIRVGEPTVEHDFGLDRL